MARKASLRTKSGLLNPSKVSLRDRFLFTDTNDHNPVVGTLCSDCNGTGKIAGSLDDSHPPCRHCEGIGAIDIPVHFFPNDRPSLEAKARKDDWIRCPGCSVAFSLEKGHWTGWRHVCGQRIVVLPADGATRFTELTKRLRKKEFAVRKFIRAVFDNGLLNVASAAFFGAIFTFQTWFSSNPDLPDALREPNPSKVLLWYAEQRSALHSTSVGSLAYGYLVATSISWIAMCVTGKCVDAFLRTRNGVRWREAVENVIELICLMGLPIGAALFVFPSAALHENTFPPFPSTHWSEFSRHILLSIGAVITWTATLLGLIASVITIYEAITKPPEMNRRV